MRYEIQHGENTTWRQAGNEYEACIETLREEARHDDIQLGPFVVSAMPRGEERTIEMQLVVGLRLLSSNGETSEEHFAPLLDLSKW